jgi:hypothetical protein
VNMPCACIVVGLPAMLLSGCAAWEPKMDAAMASWVGESADSVVAAWGRPDRSQVTKDYTIYVWSRSSKVTLRGDTVTTATSVNGIFESSSYMMPSETINLSCSRTFAVDQANRIVQWGWRGDCSRYVKVSAKGRSAGAL